MAYFDSIPKPSLIKSDTRKSSACYPLLLISAMASLYTTNALADVCSDWHALQNTTLPADLKALTAARKVVTASTNKAKAATVAAAAADKAAKTADTALATAQTADDTARADPTFVQEMSLYNTYQTDLTNEKTDPLVVAYQSAVAQTQKDQSAMNAMSTTVNTADPAAISAAQQACSLTYESTCPAVDAANAQLATDQASLATLTSTYNADIAAQQQALNAEASVTQAVQAAGTADEQYATSSAALAANAVVTKADNALTKAKAAVVKPDAAAVTADAAKTAALTQLATDIATRAAARKQYNTDVATAQDDQSQCLGANGKIKKVASKVKVVAPGNKQVKTNGKIKKVQN